jgi:hypothetical protein
MKKNVGRMGEMRNACNILIGKRQRKILFVGLGVDSRIILKLVLNLAEIRRTFMFHKSGHFFMN